MKNNSTNMGGKDDLCTKVQGKLKGCDIHLPVRLTGAIGNAILWGPSQLLINFLAKLQHEII